MSEVACVDTEAVEESGSCAPRRRQQKLFQDNIFETTQMDRNLKREMNSQIGRFTFQGEIQIILSVR
jgi:hypothetical protein